MAMTFWGKERFRQHAHGKEHEGHAQKKEHGTKHHEAHVPHESPKSMVSAAGRGWRFSRPIGGFVGISTAFTGGQQWAAR
jgi:hypothetical protein